MALGHYENFTVASIFLPRDLRPHFYSIYAFCRYADDLADEIADTQESCAALRNLRHSLEQLYRPEARADRPDHSSPPFFPALAETIERFDIPMRPFLDLIDAFEQDRRINRYNDMNEVLAYCRRSADPVGRLVLYLCGYRDVQRQRLADQTCTALQLTNFWQDVRRDYTDRNRIYIPRDVMERFGVSEQTIATAHVTDGYRAMIQSLVDQTQALFDAGAGLLPLIDRRLRSDIELFSMGGEAILEAIRRAGYDTLTTRPKLNSLDKAKLLCRAAVRRWVGSI